jgi:hypothetical protein
MPIEIKGRESITIPQGVHKGEITKVEERTSDKGYVYIDVSVTVGDVELKDGKNPEIRYGVPADLTQNTKLGKLLMAFGITQDQIVSGEPIDVEDVLKTGTKVEYLTKDETTEKGTFARNFCDEFTETGFVDGTVKKLS